MKKILLTLCFFVFLTVSMFSKPLFPTPVTTSKSHIISNETAVTYTISGTIKNWTVGLQGVVVTAVASGTSYTATTLANGTYSIANLPAGLNYVVSAAKSSFVFPVSTPYTSLNANQTLDFSANNLISGTIKNGTALVSGAKVQLTLPWTDTNHGYLELFATSDSQGNYSFDNASLVGYKNYNAVLMNTWDNNSVAYFPAKYPTNAISTVAQTFNFNSQVVTPVVNITAPTASTINTPTGTAITLSASTSLSFDDGATTVSGLVFNISGQNITGVKSGNTYTATWSPSNSQFYSNYTLTATATSTNGVTGSATSSFYLNCTGSCPNQLPVITWNTPVSTSINQPNGFQTVPISISAVDNDGSVSNVSITINGSTSVMTLGANNTYTYNFMPTAYQDYPVVITATDNVSASRTFNSTIKIFNTSFVPLPAKVVLGYAHTWDDASAPFMYFSSMTDKKYNVVAYSFIQTVNADGFTPQLTTNSAKYMTNGAFDPQLLKNDIQSLRSKGIPVIVSIGGMNGHVSLETTAQKNTFVAGLEAIVDQYNFDGIDLDFEGGSMSFGGGSLTDFSYASISTIPKLKNVIDAFKEIKQHYGSGFILTAAPETLYVQSGYATYSNTAGAFLPVLHNLRNELDLLMVQLYNTGSVYGLDNKVYEQATPDFLVAMSDMLIKGFNVGSTGFHFDGFPASKIVVGLPACAGAAPNGGYIAPADGIKALDYLRLGTTYTGRTYTLQAGGPSPGLRGVMTWSINWDAACATGYEFSKAYSAYFSAIALQPVANFTANKTTIVPGASVTFSDTSTNTPTSWAWTFTGGTPSSSTAQNPVVTYATAGNYDVGLVATNTGGSTSKTTTSFITVSATPVANFTANKTAIAKGGSVTFTDTSANIPTSRAWTFTGGTPSSSTLQNPVVSYATAGNYAVSLIATNANGSNTKTTASYITVNAVPVAGFSASKTTVATGDSVSFSDTSTNTPTSWAWTFTGGTPSTSTAQNPIVTYATKGNYAVGLTVTNAGGTNTKNTTNYITVNALPVTDFSADKTAVIAGGSVAFTDASLNTPTSWAWTFPGGSPSISAAQNPVVTYATAGNYNVSLTTTNNVGTNTKTINNYIAVSTPPVANFSTDKTLLGAGGSVTFSDSSTNAPTSWSWTFTGGTPSTSTAQNPVVTYPTIGSYAVSLTATNIAGANTKTTTNYITVNAAPVTNFSANKTAIATGTPVTFSDTSINTPTSWAWTFTGGTPSTSTAQNPVVSYAAAGQYAVSLTTTNSNGSNTKTVTDYMTVSATPVASFTADKTQIAAGTSVNFTDDSGNTPTSWAWTFTGGTPSTSTAQNPLVSYATAGKYAVSLSVTNIAGTNTKTLSNYIVVNTAPVAGFNASKTIIKSGDSVTFSDASVNTPTSWAWTFTGGTPSSSTAQNPVVTYPAAGNYPVSLTVSNIAGTNTKAATNYITVNSVPVASFSASKTSVGTGSPITFTDTSINGPTSWAWTFTGGTPSTSTAQNPVVTYAKAGNYTVSLAVTNSAGTNTKTATNYITVGAEPVANFSANTTSVTAGDAIKFTDASTNAPTSWAWTFAGGTPSTSTSQNPTVSYATPGNYPVSLTATNSTGSNSKNAVNYISVNPLVLVPVASFEASAIAVTSGETISFTDTSTNGPTSWAWTFTGGMPGVSSVQNPSVTYTTPGVYPVTLTATNSKGANTMTKTAYITIKAQPEVISIDNYALSFQSETCINSNNGIIGLVAKKEHAYTAVITASGFNKTASFSAATPLKVTNLSAGVYTICITIDGRTDYSQCFSGVIAEPQSLAVLTKVSKTAKTVSLTLSGSDSYRILLNEKEFVTSEKEITLALDLNTTNVLSVSTAKLCQGVYSETIEAIVSPIFYPNPVLNTLQISIPLNADTAIEVPVVIYSLSGQQQLSSSYKVIDGVIEMDVSRLAVGTYIVAVDLNGKIVKHKIIKQ